MSIEYILTNELHMRKVYARWMPQDLCEENYNNHVAVMIDFMSWYAAEEPLLHYIVVGDKVWVHYYTTLTKH